VILDDDDDDRGHTHHLQLYTSHVRHHTNSTMVSGYGTTLIWYPVQCHRYGGISNDGLGMIPMMMMMIDRHMTHI